MNLERQQAIQYLRAQDNRFWRWADEGAVLVWEDGSTLAFREEVLEVLRWLAPNGLPPFGAVVLMLAACRGKYPDPNQVMNRAPRDLIPFDGPRPELLEAARKQAFIQMHAAVKELQKVSQLPSELIKGLKAKCVLAEVIFEPSKVERQAQPGQILRALQTALPDAELNAPAEVRANVVRHLHILANGLHHHTRDTLLVRLLTGLDALPDEAEIQLPSFERARRLLEELKRDPEHNMLSLAARELMAAIRLPRRLAEHDELALGGVADITNRGPLDRLLLSELAHDDLTLAVRVALNESLYLRREPPRHKPPGTLAILLDSGLRLWGVPRVLALAAALALVAREKQFSHVLAWRASGKKVTEADLLTRDGIIAHLGTLETAAHCGDALEAFVKALPNGHPNQSVIITHPDALDDPAFRRRLCEHAESVHFVATVDRSGRFEMHALPMSQRQPLCAADLDLDSILKEPIVPLIDKTKDPSLPAILGVEPFPLLLTATGRADYWTKAPDGRHLVILDNRRLVEFRDEHMGCRVLSSDLPAGKTFWMEADAHWVHIVKAPSSQRTARLISVSRSGGEQQVTDLMIGSGLLSVYRQGDVLLCIHTHSITAHSLEDGQRLGRILSLYRWVRGRYFSDDKNFYFIAWDGQTVRFQEVPSCFSFAAKKGVQIFDREGEEGPSIVLNGRVFSLATSENFYLTGIIGEGDINQGFHLSRDGHRIFRQSELPKDSAWMDLRTKEVKRGPFNMDPELVLDPCPRLPTWNTIRTMYSIAALPGEGLAFCGHKGHWRKIVLNQKGRIEIVSCPRVYSGVIPFSNHPIPARFGCSLQVAKWPGGSTAWLDSRGLLHLKSRNPNVPELSLVLCEGEVAAWSSDGARCGNRFFLGVQLDEAANAIFERVKQFMNLL